MNEQPFHMVWDQWVGRSNRSTPTTSCTATRTDWDISPATVARFWAKVAVANPEECWLWIGAVSKNGYGSFGLAGKAMSAHRVAFRLKTGAWPEGRLLVRHKCDVRRCVNPDHLETGTHVENAQDMVERGGWSNGDQSGQNNGRAKLNGEAVARIRELFAAGHTNVAIGRVFKVKHATISAIRRGKSWSKPDVVK